MLDLPPAPTGLTEEEVDEHTIALRWNPVGRTTRYRVEAYLLGTDRLTTTYVDNTTTSYSFAGLECGTPYTFKVSAQGDGSLFAATWGPRADVWTDTSRRCSATHEELWRENIVTFHVVGGIPVPRVVTILTNISAAHKWKSSFTQTTHSNAFTSHHNVSVIEDLLASALAGVAPREPWARTPVYVGSGPEPVFTIENSQWNDPPASVSPGDSLVWGGSEVIETGPGSPDVFYRSDLSAYANVKTSWSNCRDGYTCTPHTKSIWFYLW